MGLVVRLAVTCFWRGPGVHGPVVGAYAEQVCGLPGLSRDVCLNAVDDAEDLHIGCGVEAAEDPVDPVPAIRVRTIAAVQDEVLVGRPQGTPPLRVHPAKECLLTLRRRQER